MTDSILDSKPSHILCFPLTIKQQVWLQFIAPGVVTSILYILTIAIDVAVGIGLILERHPIPGMVTLFLVYLPATVCFILEMSSCQKSETWNFKSVVFRIFKQSFYFVIFPLKTIRSIGELIFWLVEAAQNKENLEESLSRSILALPYSVHVYLFLQPFLQCAPQAILQLHLLLLQISRDSSTEKAQIVCVLCSLATVALSIVFYHRYESRCAAGGDPVLQNRTYKEITKNENEHPFITREPNLYKTNDFEEDNPAGKMVAFLSWFFFLLTRVLCLVISSHFHLLTTLALISFHYTLMLIYFLTLKSSNFFYKLYLSYIAIFCLVEVSVRFKKLSILYLIFFTSCICEHVGLTIYWVVYSKWSEWWFQYAIYAIVIGHLITIIFLIIYLLLSYLTVKNKRVTVVYS